MGQCVAAEVEPLLDTGLGRFGRGRCAVVEQNHGGGPGFRHAQAHLVGILGHEGGQLGIRRCRCGPGHGLGYGEPAAVTGFERLAGQDGPIDARQAHARAEGGAVVLGGILVAQLGLEHFGRGVVFGEGVPVLLLAELAGDTVEEAGGLADLAQDQLLSGADAGFPGPVHEAELLGFLLEVLSQAAFADQFLERQGTSGLLLGLLTDAVELAPELGLAEAAVSR